MAKRSGSPNSPTRRDRVAGRRARLLDTPQGLSGLPPLVRGSWRWRAASIGMELFLAAGAIGGGIALMAGPRGEIIPLPVSALAGSRFTSYFVPGAILFTVLGLGPLAAALLAWRRHAWAPFLATLAGVALFVWLAVEIAVVGYSNRPPLQAFYLGLAVLMTATGFAWMRQSRSGEVR